MVLNIYLTHTLKLIYVFIQYTSHLFILMIQITRFCHLFPPAIRYSVHSFHFILLIFNFNNISPNIIWKIIIINYPFHFHIIFWVASQKYGIYLFKLSNDTIFCPIYFFSHRNYPKNLIM